MRLRRSKCHFMLLSVEYLRHKISDKSIQPTKAKICAIVKAPALNNLSQLKPFLGMLNYHAKFLLNTSSRLAPLYKLPQNRVPWSWKGEQLEAFQKAKEALTSADVLVHYDPSLKLYCHVTLCLMVSGQFSPISWMMEQNTLCVAFASCTLSPAQKTYA